MSVLATLRPQKGSKKPMKRLGRGDASGHGGTSTKGHKGQKARSSAHIPRGFEGGQMPLHRRSPKWGFTNFSQVTFNVVNLDDLSNAFENNAEVNATTLASKGLIRRKTLPLKILGRGKLTKALKITADAFSQSAKAAIESAKGSATVIQKKKQKAAS